MFEFETALWIASADLSSLQIDDLVGEIETQNPPADPLFVSEVNQDSVQLVGEVFPGVLTLDVLEGNPPQLRIRHESFFPLGVGLLGDYQFFRLRFDNLPVTLLDGGRVAAASGRVRSAPTDLDLETSALTAWITDFALEDQP